MNTDSVKQLKEPSPSGRISSLWECATLALWMRSPVWLCYIHQRINEFWYREISSRIWPRQKWVAKAAGRVWVDKVELVRILLYTTIIHFVEDEECFSTVVFSPEDETMIRVIYNWARFGRRAYEVMIEHAYPPVGDLNEWNTPNSARDAAYAEVRRLEEEMTAKDDLYCAWITNHRGILWT